MDTSGYNLDYIGINTQAIHDFIREGFSKVLVGDENTYSVCKLFNFDYYHKLISELIDEPLEVEDFNGWQQDFYHQFEFGDKKFVFYGSVWRNSYTLERQKK